MFSGIFVKAPFKLSYILVVVYIIKINHTTLQNSKNQPSFPHSTVVLQSANLQISVWNILSILTFTVGYTHVTN